MDTPRKLDYAVESGWQITETNKMKLPDKKPVLIVPAMVADSNPGGSMFGGWLMSQIDIAGSIPAIRHARGQVVTAAVKYMNFLAPLYISDLVNLYAEVTHVGRSSMTIDIDVWVQRDFYEPVVLNVASAQLVFVAVDKSGKSRTLIDR